MGVFECIVEYIPLPRMWQWQLSRIQHRCVLAPQITMCDLSKIADEILADTSVFRGKNQQNLLVRLARNSEVSFS
jgi:hypothetical protein